MIINHILEDKRRVQKELSEQAGHDPSKYIALAHKKVEEAQERYEIQFRYAEMEVDSHGEPLPEEHASMPCDPAEISLATDRGNKRSR